MFRNRKTSQKPTDDFYADFKASFPHLSSTPAVTLDGPEQASVVAADAIDVTLQSRDFVTGAEAAQDGDPTPKPQQTEGWRLTPSMLDPNSYTFASFANQPPGYYTPTPGGTSTLYHSQAGDLHASGLNFGLGTPSSVPTSEVGITAGQAATASRATAVAVQSTVPNYHHYSAIATHHFDQPEPFSLHIPPSQAFIDPTYGQHPTDLDHVNNVPHSAPPHGDIHMDMDISEQSPLLSFHTSAFHAPPVRVPNVVQQTEGYRYHSTLHAPTAMIRQAEEIPITYLNKGQAYTLSIVDRTPPPVSITPTRYRTFIRISFEDEQQRKRPAACWQLWKEGRGTNEAHHRGGRLQAVEFVNQGQKSSDQAARHNVELTYASFDGFAVTWSPPLHGPAECAVAVRFNFLSTDFSHSKGVKGIPVRLCAKTEQIPDAMQSVAPNSKPEICFCKVKLFRDHGAERKLSNDVAHVKRTIEKLRQQIAQADSGMREFAKRKRCSLPTKPTATKPGKVQKHKRTWSMSSASSVGGRAALEEDLQQKLATLQDMFTSTRPASILYLKGDEADDPDLHPVKLTGKVPVLTKTETGESSSTWEKVSGPTTAGTPSMVSPTPSSHSVHSRRCSSGFQQLVPQFPVHSAGANEWRQLQDSGDLQAVQQLSSPVVDVPAKIPRMQPAADGEVSGWIEVLGVDQNYQPPPERPVKPVACFYVQPHVSGREAEDGYYRAVYLMQRTLKDLVTGIAAKSNVDGNQVVRTIHMAQNGLSILYDDDMVRELSEGRDMIAEFHPLRAQSPVKPEWEGGPTDVQVDGDVTIDHVSLAGYELRLHY